MDTQQYFNKYQKSKERSSTYLNRKFNTQTGDNNKQVFIIRLLSRLKKETPLCDGMFYEGFVHFGCGADGKQAVTCLNKTNDEFKSNKAKCPGCAKVYKVLRNEKYTEDDPIYKKALKQKASRRNIWPIYSLDKRKEVEFLELSGKGINDIIEQFSDEEGNFLDLSKSKGCALRITRTHKGINSEYSYKGLRSKKYLLTPEDIANIKKTYLAPEDALIRSTAEDIQNLFESQLEVDTVADSEMENLESLSDDDEIIKSDKKASKKEGKRTRSRSKDKDESDIDDGSDDELGSIDDKSEKVDSDSDSDDVESVEKDLEDLADLE